MKKLMWVVALALVLSSSFAGRVAADNPHAAQDQAFLQQLAQQTTVPMSPAMSESPLPVLALCNQTSCRFDSDCDVACPGGGYCQSGLKRCNYI